MDRTGMECSVSIQDLLSQDDIAGVGIIGVIMGVVSCIMYERYSKYKKLYSKYRNMRPGTKELTAEPRVTIATEDGEGGRGRGDDGLPRSSL